MPMVDKENERPKERKKNTELFLKKVMEKFEEVEERRARLRRLERHSMRKMDLLVEALPPAYSEEGTPVPEKKKRS